MFPLAGKKFPTSAGELADALTTALAGVFTVQSGDAVDVTGGKFPSVKTVTINLDGAVVSVNKLPPRAACISS